MAKFNKFDVDYASIANTITKKAYRLADVKDQLESVGFGVVKFKTNDKGAELWEVQNAADGDYIVALYDEEELEKTAAIPWSALVSLGGNYLQVSYKGDPLVKMSASKLGIPPAELHQAEEYLPAKLASNKKLVKALLSELSDTARQETYKRYPELT